jgi:hypothetical protein
VTAPVVVQRTMRAHPRRGARPPQSSWGLITMLSLLACMGMIGYDAVEGDGKTLTAFLFIPILFAIATPIVTRAGKRETTFDLTGMMFAALSVKILATFARFIVVNDLYGGVADAGVYHTWGARLVESFRGFDFSVNTGQRIPGTGTIRYVTGLVYLFTGSNQFAGFLVFSFLSFLGLYFLYRAFALAVPNGDRSRYAKLLFFWPSLLFWPSSTGKEAWMMLGIGLGAWGAARVLKQQRGGFILFGLGLLGAGLVRPHVSLLAFIALFAAYLLRPSTRLSGLGPVTKGIGIVVLVLAGGIVSTQAENFFGVDSLSTESVSETLDDTSNKTGKGGSSFDAPDATNPAQIPLATVTVLFRPFPFEAHNGQAVISALEGLVLLVLFARSWRRFLAFPRTVRQRPYIAFAAAYTVMFIFAFSSIANFGILARQRVQMLPFVFVLAALPPAAEELRKMTRRRRTVGVG